MTFLAPPNVVSLMDCLILVLLVPLVIAGLGIMNTGLGRTRSAAHYMLAALTMVALAACVYVICGFSWEGFAGRPVHILMLHGRPFDWIASEPFFLHGLIYNGSMANGALADVAALLQVFAVGIAVLIPLSSGADRWRLSASLFSTALLAGWTYPLFAHWVWGGGWLSRLGTSFGLGAGFLDAGGASTIHVVGGVTALSIAWILGPRYGKHAGDGGLIAIPGYNIVYVLFGCSLMLPGWIALNCVASLLFAGATPVMLPLIVLNTVLSGAAACLAAAVTTGIRFTKPDASLCANGWVGGMVASSALGAFVSPATAIFCGLIVGAVVTLAIEFLELHMGIDDPGGAVAVHGVAGILGLLAVGFFAHAPAGLVPASYRGGQILAQVIGVAALIGFVLPMTYCLNLALDRLWPQRVDRQGELLGMDLRELGGGAYPEFVTRTDEHQRN